MSGKTSKKSKKIVLGSGKLYIVEFNDSIPANAVIETENNMLGAIKGGASVSYEVEFYAAVDDHNVEVKKTVTSETVVLKSGVMSWNGYTLEQICSTARVTEDSASKVRTVKIGGAANYNGKVYLIRFVHKDPKDGVVRLTIVGSNENGFEFSFAKDKETVIDVEFKAQSLDDEGTLLMYEEEFKPENSTGVENREKGTK